MQKILVIRFSSLGDIVLAEPTIRQLRNTYPSSEIHFLTKPQYRELVSLFTGIDRVHLWESDQYAANLLNVLKSERFDLVIDLHNNLRSRRVSTLLGAKTYRCRKEWFARTATVRLRWLKMQPHHALERYASAWPQNMDRSHKVTPLLRLSDTHLQAWQQRAAELRIEGEYYCIAAGAAHATKRAPHSLWQEIAAHLGRVTQARALLIGAPEEREHLQELNALFGGSSLGVLCDDSITTAASALAGAQLVLSNDSGVAHLAAALDRPMLALFGPTHPILGFAPRGKYADYVTVNEYCSPCSLHGSRPCHRTERFCFTKMNAAEIIDQISTLVQRGNISI